MKNNHAIAFACFIVAGVLYYTAISQSAAGGIAIVGGFFEMAAWKNLFKRSDKENA
jgi:hypothetical protein